VASHLIYLGRVGEKHRVALFESTNLIKTRIPVKDVDEIPDGDYLNFRVEYGVITPNLGGSKVLCVDPTTAWGIVKAGAKNFNWDVLNVFEGEDASYCYGRGYFPNSGNDWFFAGYLLCGFRGYFSVWDGKLRESDLFIVSALALNTGTNIRALRASPWLLAMDAVGQMSFVTHRHLAAYSKVRRVIQAGTPALTTEPVSPSGSNYRNDAILHLKGDDRKKVLLDRKDIETCGDEKLFVCWAYWNTEAVCDLRKYTNAQIFGVESVSNAKLVMFPENTKRVHLGFLKLCGDIRFIYLPAGVETLCDLFVPKLRVKKLTIYSTSPVVREFAEKWGCTLVEIDSTEEVKRRFYSGGSEYVDVADAAALVALVADETTQSELHGDILPAVLVSMQSKGVDTAVLREKYQLVTHDLGRQLPKNVSVIEFYPAFNGITDTSLERIRTVFAAMSMFFPFVPLEKAFKPKHQYLANRFEFRDFRAYFCYDVQDGSERPKGFILLEDMSRHGFFHCFSAAFEQMWVFFYLHYLCSVYTCNVSGVMRYADKLGACGNYGTITKRKINDAIVHTFAPVVWGVPKARGLVVGIDLHTGKLATMNTTKSNDKIELKTWRKNYASQSMWFTSVSRISDMKLYSAGTKFSDIVPEMSGVKK
jgi:hypothetical protein